MAGYLQRESAPEIAVARTRTRGHWLAIGFLLLAIVAGGSSRPDVLAPVVVHVGALLVLAVVLLRGPLPPARFILYVAVAILALAAFQLIALPGALIPPRPLADAASAVVGLPRRTTITLVPDRTLVTLGAMLPPFAALCLGLRLDARGALAVVRVVSVAAVLSALLGLAQFVTGVDGGFYVYGITNSDSSVGLFANANHQALFLCCGVAAIMCWLATIWRAREAGRLPATVIAASAIGVMFLSVLATQSRAGVILFVAAVAIGGSLLPRRARSRGANLRQFLVMALIAIVPLAAMLVLGLNSNAFDQTFDPREGFAARWDLQPTFLRIAHDYLPWGAGLGSFDPVFRGYESVGQMEYSYLNAAHNDYAQVLIEAGIPGAVLILLVLGWFAVAAVRAWQAGIDDMPGMAQDVLVARTGVLMVGMLLIHSGVDYPLRTAALATLIGLFAGIVTEATRTALRNRRYGVADSAELAPQS